MRTKIFRKSFRKQKMTYSAKAAFLKTTLTGSEFNIDEETFGESRTTRSVTKGSNIPKISSLN